MQFTSIALFAAISSLALASPVEIEKRCSFLSWLDCGAALGPAFISCIAAALQAEADPLTDAACVAAGINDIANPPASCSACF